MAAPSRAGAARLRLELRQDLPRHRLEGGLRGRAGGADGEFRKVHQFNVFTVNTPMQHGLAAFMADPRATSELLPAFYQRKRDLFRAGLAGSRFRLLPSEGSYFQCVDYSAISRTCPEASAGAHHRDRRGGHSAVGVLPGGFEQRIARFCFAKKDETLNARAGAWRRWNDAAAGAISRARRPRWRRRSGRPDRGSRSCCRRRCPAGTIRHRLRHVEADLHGELVGRREAHQAAGVSSSSARPSRPSAAARSTARALLGLAGGRGVDRVEEQQFAVGRQSNRSRLRSSPGASARRRASASRCGSSHRRCSWRSIGA